jgi:serine/threonine protein kinase
LSQTCAVDASFSERTSSYDTNFRREGSGPVPDPRESYRDAEVSQKDGYSSGSDSDEAALLSPRRLDIQDFKVQCTKSLKNGHFVQDYKIGEMLGQGSYGIVFAARRRNVDGPEGDVAVKLIDKVEMPPEDIERETKIHAMLDHPNILKVHDVIDERFFVCIVTDRFRGGDLVKCLQESKRRLKPSKIVHIAKQLLEGVGYLHTLAIVHRDVKADNILLEREDLVDPSCRIILADFGFACVCKMGDRLQRRCGTRMYWAPEMWDRNYASKVDVWAVGITIFGKGALNSRGTGNRAVLTAICREREASESVFHRECATVRNGTLTQAIY